MRFTEEPKAFFIAETQVNGPGLQDMLIDLGVKSDWSTETPSHGELLVEVAGRLCYKSFEPGLNPNVTKVREGNQPYIRNILSSGHGSVLEHACVTFAFIGVSRVFTHEIVRHRAGTAFSQESLRYVRLDDINMWFPDGLDSDEMLSSNTRALSVDRDGLKDAGPKTNGDEARSIFRWLANKSGLAYSQLCELFDIENLTNFTAKKALTSAFRRIAPIGLSTNIIVTANHRAWRHIIEQRCTPHAEEEICRVIFQVAEELKERFPNIYQDMELDDYSMLAHLKYRKI